MRIATRTEARYVPGVDDPRELALAMGLDPSREDLAWKPIGFTPARAADLALTLEAAMWLVQKIAPADVGRRRELRDLYPAVAAVVTRLSYEPEGVFAYAARILANVAMKHALRTGNKRMALCTASVLLAELGYRLAWKTARKACEGPPETMVGEFVKSLEKRFGQGDLDENTLAEMANWLKGMARPLAAQKFVEGESAAQTAKRTIFEATDEDAKEFRRALGALIRL